MKWEFAGEPRLAGWHAMSGRRGGPGRHGRHWGGQWRGGGPGGMFFEPQRGQRARRGDIRVAILGLLAEEPRNGYQLMQEIERRSEGAWRPSSGSVYPKLQQLEDEGLVRSEPGDGGRLFHITDAGRAEAEARKDEAAPWDAAAGSVDREAWEMMGMIRQIGMALWQLVNTGTEQQIAQAREVLSDTRKALHRILGEDTPPEDRA